MEMENGNGNGHGNGKPYRILMDDEDVAEQFEMLVSSAHVKDFTDEEIGYGLLSATVETLLANGEPECCVMQLLIDFMYTFYDYWHMRMSEEWENGEE